MAIVKGPCHSELASGNMGSVCYSRWRGRAVARDVWSGTVPNTSGQVEVQGYLAEAVLKWRTVLTLEQADAWRSYAEEHPVVDRLGDIRASTGFNRFRTSSLMMSSQSSRPWIMAVGSSPLQRNGSERRTGVASIRR